MSIIRYLLLSLKIFWHHSEQEILREEISMMCAVKNRQAEKISELEGELKALRGQMEGMAPKPEEEVGCRTG